MEQDKDFQFDSNQEKNSSNEQVDSDAPLSFNGQKDIPNSNDITVTLLQELVALLRPKPFYKRHPIIFFGGLILLIIAVYSCFADDSSTFSSDCIAVVRIDGTIMDTKPTLAWISELEKMDSVKGILLRIDSPGGGAAASQEIHSALKKLGQKKPIIASMGSTAASGGLMVAMAAEYIVANPSTITGSIGVRMDIPQIYKLLDFLGLGQETLTSGKFKDAASMMRALDPEERAYLQNIIEDLHEQFMHMVAEGRHKKMDEVKKIADGRIFTGREAYELGLVDALGGQDVALAKLYEKTGVSPATELHEKEDMRELYNELLEGLLKLNVSASQGEALFLYK